MDSSYGNGGQVNPGVKPGVIASGPDPSNLGLTASGLSSTTPGVIASGPDPVDTPEVPSPVRPGFKLSRTPTGGRPSGGGSMVMGVGETSNAASRKPRRGLLIGIIVAVILIVAAVVMAVVMMNRGNGGGENTDTASLVSPTTIQEQFNSFYHYLTSNEPNNVRDITTEEMIGTSFYIDNADLTTLQRDNYLDGFGDKFTAFVEIYSNTYGEQPLDNIYVYVYTLHKLEEISIYELRSIYNSEGIDAAKKRITDAYQDYDTDGSNELLDEYIISEQEYLMAFVDSLATGDESGLIDKQMLAMQARDALELAAYYDLEYLYSEVYGENLNEGVSAS